MDVLLYYIGYLPEAGRSGCEFVGRGLVLTITVDITLQINGKKHSIVLFTAHILHVLRLTVILIFFMVSLFHLHVNLSAPVVFMSTRL